MKRLMIGTTSVLLFATILCAQAPETITAQGLLTDGSGTPLPGPVDLTFKLLDDKGVVWQDTHTGVTLNRGIYNVLLGSITSLLAVRFDDPLNLEVSIGHTVVSTTPVSSVPFALGMRGLYTTGETSTEGVNVVGGSAGNAVPAAVEGATISGGGDPDNSSTSMAHYNKVFDNYGTVGGGAGNEAGSSVGDASVSEFATVGGGANNHALAEGSTIGGGGSVEADSGNVAYDYYNAIGGGNGNRAGRDDGNYTQQGYASIAGGRNNKASGAYSAVGGGWVNNASGSYSTIPGGESNKATGTASFAAGQQAKALHNHSFVWAAGDGGIQSTAEGQFLIDAPGNVGIGLTNPASPLSVNGIIESTSGGIKLPDDTIIAGSGDFGDGRSLDASDGSPINALWLDTGGNVHVEQSLTVADGLSADGTISLGTAGSSGITTIDGDATIVGTVTYTGIPSAASGDDLVLFTSDNSIRYISSSARFKDNIEDLELQLEDVLQLRPVSFRHKETGQNAVGLIAEEVAELIPQVVSFEEDGRPRGVQYRLLSVYAIKALQIEHERNNRLEERMAALEAAMNGR